VEQLPVGGAVALIGELAGRGLRQFLLFGVTPAEKKDACGSYAADPDAPVNRVLRGVREAGIDAVMYADLCFCEYTEHGHCGPLIEGDDPLVVDNDRALELLGRTAVAQAE